MTNATTTPTLAEVHDLYRKAMAADDAFTAALVARYGSLNAGVARYRRDHPADVLAAAQASRAAFEAYLVACRQRNADPNDVADAVAADQVEPNPDGIDYLPPADPGPVDIDEADVPY